MKNSLRIFFISVFFSIFIFYSNIIYAEDIIIDSEVVDIKDNGNLIEASGKVKITDQDNITITGNRLTYNKLDQILEIEGQAIFTDEENNYRAKSNKIIFFREKNLIYSKEKTELNFLDSSNTNTIIKIESENSLYDRKKKVLEINNNVILTDYLNKYKLFSKNVIYKKIENIITSVGITKIDYNNRYEILTKNISLDRNQKIFFSQNNTSIEDEQNNVFKVSNFEFNLNNKIIKSKNLSLKDAENNILELKNGYVDLNSKEIVGSDYVLNLNKNSFGNDENDPRLIGRYVIVNNKEAKMKKSSFTTCKNNKDKCPAWSISADEIKHKKEEKKISYKNAWLKIYDKPIAYFPYFFHPDPTVDRQSGFLFPQFINSSNLGFSTQIPYFKVIDIDKDITLSPRVYTNNNLFLQTEYRQANKNSNFITDFSYNKKDKINSHFFSNLIGEKDDSFYELKIETVSSDNYIKKYQIQSPIIKNDTVLNSSLLFEKLDQDYTFSTSVNIYEDLSKTKNDKYEYSFPEYKFVKETYLNNSIFDTLSFRSSGNYRKFETNIDEADISNELVFKSSNYSQLKNFNSNFNLLFRNINSYGDLSNTYKDGKDYRVLSSALYNLKYPLIKKNENTINYLTPLASFRFSPNKGLNLQNEITRMNFESLFGLDRFNEKTIESGGSATLGFEFKSNNNLNQEKLNLGLAVNLRNKIDEDLPISSSLGQKTSDIIGYSGINITENLSLNYNFIIDQNLKDTNYNLISLDYNNDKLQTSFEYFEKSNTVGDESYLKNSTKLEINKTNSISFETNKNIDKNLTDYYNLIYKYKNDCLEASVVYNKQFYNDDGINSSKNIFFKLSFLPFGTISSPNVND